MSDRWLIPNPILTLIPAIGIIAVMLVVFLFFVTKRSSRLLALRIVALVLMMISLLLIILRPADRGIQPGKVALLTANYNSKDIDSLLDVSGQIKLIHTNEVPDYRNSTSFDSYHQLVDSHEQFDYVLGDGLNASGLDQLQQNSFRYLPSPYPLGIIQLSMPGQSLPYRKNTIEGVINNRGEKTSLLLERAGIPEDSVTISQKGYQSFQLSFYPKASGNFLYDLKINNGDSSASEILPIHVSEQHSSNILFLQYYPTFETQYLKNFLAKHHKLLLRYQLSKGIYRFEALNRKLDRINRLSSLALEPFDLVIIDSDILKALSSSEKTELQQAVKNGLGMIILFNEKPGSNQVKTFLPIDFETFARDTAQVFLSKAKKTLPAWPVKIKSDQQINSVITNKNRILSGYVLSGFGKVGFQLLQQTYRLSLEGDSASYSSLWSSLIERSSRSTDSKFKISIKNTFPIFQDDPINVEIVSSGQQPTLMSDSISIPLKENILIDDVWMGKTWAGEPGWHSLTVTEDSTQLHYYVSENNSWSSLATANSINQTTLKSTSIEDKKQEVEVIRPIPPLIFYLLFLLSAGSLWLIPKL